MCAAVPFYGCSTGSVWNEPKRVLNRDHHPFFDTTNGIQGTYYMIVHDVTNPSASFGAIFPDRCFYHGFYDKMWNLQRLPRQLMSGFYTTFSNWIYIAKLQYIPVLMYRYWLTLVVVLRWCGGSLTKSQCHPRILISSPCEQYKSRTRSVPLARHCGNSLWRSLSAIAAIFLILNI